VRLIKNTGNDRVIDELRTCLLPQSSIDIASPKFSLFAFADIRTLLEKLESAMLGAWFTALWNSLPSTYEAKNSFLTSLQDLASHRDPFIIYTLILHHMFKDRGEELDEDQIVKSATGIRNTVVWKKLFRFQRDGVVGAIDKPNRFGGRIIADSVGLGKTFEALAIIKYHELRNDRVLVLCPKRLRDNWTIYKANDRFLWRINAGLRMKLGSLFWMAM
jgi:hypothetical protein